MTGGFGHVRDMQIRDKNNRGLLQNIKAIHKKVAIAFIPKVLLDKITIAEDIQENSEQTRAEISKIQAFARKRRRFELILWLFIGSCLIALFGFLMSVIL